MVNIILEYIILNIRKDVLMGNESVNKELLVQQAGLDPEQAEEVSASDLLKSLESSGI